MSLNDHHYQPSEDPEDAFETFDEDESLDDRWIKWTTRWDTPSFDFMSFVTLLTAVFFQGIDYSIVMPSMNQYLIKLSGDKDSTLFLGITLSMFSCATAVGSPFVGMWLDKYRMKSVLLFLTFISFVGSLIYAFAVTKEMVLVGRTIAGFGNTIYTASSLYVVRSTTLQERSAVFAKVSMMFAVAMLAGPGVNFPLTRIGTHQFGPVEFSELSSPGYVMAFFFVLSAISILCFFKEPRKKDPEAEELQPKTSCFNDWKMIFSNFPCLVLITAEFLVVFNQTSVESILTPLTLKWYDFDSFWNSLLFAGMTFMIIFWLILVVHLTKKFQDRALLLTGHLMTGTSIALTVLFLALSPYPNLKIPIWQWILGASFFVSSIPFYESVLGSLFSKLLNNPLLDGRGQSIMASTKAVASIFGPVVSTAIFNTYKGFAYVELMMGIMWFVVFVMLVLSWSSMYIENQTTAVSEESQLVKKKASQDSTTDEISLDQDIYLSTRVCQKN